MIDLLFMFKFTFIKHIESISLFVLSHLCEYCLHYYRAQKRVTYGVHLRTKIIENIIQFEVQRLDYPCRNLVI